MKTEQKKQNPGYFVYHGRIPKHGNKEQVKAKLRVHFSTHLERFFESIEMNERPQELRLPKRF